MQRPPAGEQGRQNEARRNSAAANRSPGPPRQNTGAAPRQNTGAAPPAGTFPPRPAPSPPTGQGAAESKDEASR